jgi:hypothetical protein
MANAVAAGSTAAAHVVHSLALDRVAPTLAA